MSAQTPPKKPVKPVKAGCCTRPIVRPIKR